MRITAAIVPCVVAGLLLATLWQPSSAEGPRPAYTAGGQLAFPKDYRTWTFLTSGFDMSYSAAQTGGMHMFDNVFVNPDAYAAFVATGTWPDGTMLVSEQRGASGKGSINQHGNFQTDAMGIEVHVKDDARTPRSWAFYAYNVGDASSPMIPRTASCYACHSAHGAVATTFVQFYPTLLAIARTKRTLSHAYQHDPAGTVHS